MAISAVGTAGAFPRAWYAISGAWTTVVMAAIRLPGHQPTAEVSDGCGLGPAEQLGGKIGLALLPQGRASVEGQRQGHGRRE